MSAHQLRSALRYLSEQAHEQWERPRLGVLTSYDPTSGTVKVQLQPENVETGWIPLMPIWQGNGWGFFAPPPQGSQVIVVFENGLSDEGLCLGAISSDADRPLPVPAGEAWLRHQSGAMIKLTNDSAVSILGADGVSKIVLPGNGTVLTAGSWQHTGDISATGEVTARSQSEPTALSTHQHGLTGPGSIMTTGPLPQ